MLYLVIFFINLLYANTDTFVIINESNTPTNIYIDDVLNREYSSRINEENLIYPTSRYLKVQIGNDYPNKTLTLIAGDTVIVTKTGDLIFNDTLKTKYYHNAHLNRKMLYDICRKKYDPDLFLLKIDSLLNFHTNLVDSYSKKFNHEWAKKEKSSLFSEYYYIVLSWKRNTRSKLSERDKWMSIFAASAEKIAFNDEFKDLYSSSYLKYCGKDSVAAYMDSINEIVQANDRFINFAQSKKIELSRLKGTLNENEKAMVAHKLIMNYARYDVDWAFSLFDSYKPILNDESIRVLTQTFDKYSNLMIGQPFLPINAVDVKGDTISIGDFRGKYIYIINWDIVYSQYLREASEMKRLQQKYGIENIVFIGLSMYKDKNDWISMVSDKFDFGIQLHLAGEHKKKFIRDYKGAFHPRHILISPDGKFIDSNTESVVTGIESVLDSLLLNNDTIKRKYNSVEKH